MGLNGRHPLRSLGVALLFAVIGTQAQQPESREQWIRMADIFQALGLQDGSRVADIGAGPGFFTIPMARIVGKIGRVFAVDIDEEVLKTLRQRVGEAALGNIDVIQGEPRDPKLPSNSLDAALIVDAYHEMTEHKTMLTRIREALKPGARLVIVERMPRTVRDKPRKDQMDKHVLAPELVAPELSEAGFEIVDRRDDFVSRPQAEDFFWMIIARRPG
jgi:ubiquinone/menaquinone biosynthesis C-methylase UbiE